MPETHSPVWFEPPDRKPVVLQAGEGPAINARARRIVKASDELTKGRFALHVVSCEAGYQGPPLHIHQRNDEAFFVLEGNLRFRVGEETVTVGPGGFVFVPAGTAHSFANDSEEASRHIELFAPGDFEGYFFERAALQAEGKLGPERDALLEKYGMVVVGPSIGKVGDDA
ncbi:MAG: cupin domain-containing protein [Dehalococcoidia bacterium]